MQILALDCETTGLVNNHTIRIDKQPHIIEFYGCKVDLETGEVLDELALLIKPPQSLSDTPLFGDKKTITQITGITNEMLSNAPAFKDISTRLITFIQSAPLLAAHNLSYDKEMIDLEAERINTRIFWPHGICTVEQTVHLKGQRLTLSALHEHLFNEKFNDAHRAKTDTQALVRCLIELHKRDII